MTIVPLGLVQMTQGVNDLVAEDILFAKFVSDSLSRHAKGDWGEVSEADKQENENSLNKQLKLLSTYKYGDRKILIITETEWSSTTILLQGEY